MTTITTTAAQFPPAYQPGAAVRFKAASANAGAVALNVNRLGAVPLRAACGGELQPGTLVARGAYTAVFDGQAFVLRGPATAAPVQRGPRHLLRYAGATAVQVQAWQFQMNGMRYHGGHSRRSAQSWPAASSTSVISTDRDLGAERTVARQNWYAIFAVAHEADLYASFRLMPFLRVAGMQGATALLACAGEGVHDNAPTSYAWTSADNLAGAECLVLREAGGYSGRMTTLTGNQAGAVTLADPGSLTTGDWLLPAPPGFEHYGYVGSFYFDTAEVRNFYSHGTTVCSKMIYLLQPHCDGAWPQPGVEMDASGYISPLATAIRIDSSCVLSTDDRGTYAEYFDPDGGRHVVYSAARQKENPGNLPVVISGVEVPFLYPQRFWFSNAGPVAAARISGQLNVTGWDEP